MKKSKLITLTVSILTLIGGMAFASDTFTVNSSTQEGAEGTALTNKYAKFSVAGSGTCTATAGNAVGDCDAWGLQAISDWINQSFMPAGLGNGGAATNMVPNFDDTEPGGYQLNTLTFGVGVGLPDAWLAIEQSAVPSDYAGVNPLTAPLGADMQTRTQWIDQIAIGYASSSQFAQNFRSSISFGNSWANKGDGSIDRGTDCLTDVALCSALIDQRLEQGDADMDGTGNGDSRAKQAFQQSIGIISGYNTTSDPEAGADNTENGVAADGTAIGIGQNVEQAAEGFFYSCLNCNTDNEHAFTPPQKLTYQNWPRRPLIRKINHADSATDTTWTP